MTANCRECNSKITGRGKTGLCVSCVAKGSRNSFFNRKHSDKTRKRMKASQAKRDPNTRHKFDNKSPEVIAAREKKKAENWSKLTKEEKHERLKKWLDASKRKTKTSIEEKVDKLLCDVGLKENEHYKRNVQIAIYNADFLVNNIFIIDCYGDYWHRNPKIYNDTNAIQKRLKDAERKDFLISKGYEFIHFWECDINSNINAVLDKIRLFLRSYYNLFEWESCSYAS